MKALITGASSGIGRDMARILAKLNYNLILVARNEDGLTKIKNELETENNKINITIYPMDLNIKENCYKLYENEKNIDVLINNAGFGLFGEFAETDLEKEINMINTNITAVHILTKLYLKEMVKENKGHILNVASIAGFMPGPLMATYYATKNYVVSLTRAIRKELRKNKSKVKISLLCPGPVDTNFNNVANVKFKIPGLTSEYVAKYAIKKMQKGKLIIIPGTLIKIVRWLTEMTPDVIVEEFSYHTQTKKR
ncbi:MAG TPA: ketoacyl reductase [Clostridiales bacterium]|nr:ketoacyl reductase [Clostridiales bacterium]